MIKVRYSTHASCKAHRNVENPEKYTVKGDVRVTWKNDISKLVERASERIEALQNRIDAGDDWMPVSEFMSDAYGNSWELFYKSECGNISGVLEELH